MHSRRDILYKGGAVAFVLASGQLTSFEARAQALPTRRSFGSLATNDPILEAWRDGVRRMKAMPASDRLSWASLAAIHGTASGFNRCPHGNWYFLPWHRGYILMYERIVRQLTGFQQFAMPYWDWARDRQLPRALADQSWNGQSNPLFQDGRTMQPRDSLPDEVVGPEVMRDIFSAPSFEQFGTTRPRGQNSLDPSWIRQRTGIQGTLEGNPHNSIHGIVGGIMGSARSAGDPVFMSHHCNIDRIWAIWRAGGNADSGESLWLDMPFPDHFLNPDGTPHSPKVKDLLDPAELGYGYDIQLPPSETSAVVRNLGREVTAILSGAEAPGAAARMFQATNTAIGTANNPLQVSVPVDQNLLGKVARQPAPAAPEVLDIRTLQELRARGTRALAIIRNIASSHGEGTQYRVFIDCDYLSQGVPITDQHYVGTFSFFGEHVGHGDVRPSVAFDISRTLRRIYGTQPADLPGKLNLQILPVPQGRTPISAVGDVKPEQLEVAFVEARAT